ncbi:MAG: hypothetical protein DI527_24570 [Chelatococcus sp.]|nr:MAG: hypothetical protein DI527_24570 [Chelatococcus sp.]
MDTTAVQRALIALGYSLAVDGVMGPQTRAALQTFQRGRGLAADGIAGPHTVKALQAAVAERTEPRPSPVAEPVIRIAQPRATRRIAEIIFHCTATPEGRDVSVETIRDWHVGKGWKDIGYHWIVGLDGVPRPGRPEAQVGAHCEGHNSGTLGVVYVGGVATDGKTAKDTRTPAQRAGLLAIGRALIARYPTITKVSGHNQYANKACPSFDVRRDEIGRLI